MRLKPARVSVPSLSLAEDDLGPDGISERDEKRRLPGCVPVSNGEDRWRATLQLSGLKWATAARRRGIDIIGGQGATTGRYNIAGICVITVATW